MPGSAVSDLAGRVLAGRYLLHSAIGTGASGRVYVADDTRLRRRVAVKVLHAALAEDTAFLRRFRAEAQLAASLHHPHIVTVHDWGEDDVPFMVLELLEGGSLRGLLDHGQTLTVPQAARVGRDVASALQYAHARGVLHRDIKPANLLFDEHGIVRVADFGLARALAEASWTEPAGAVFGTARYASPEQANGIQLDARSDLYSLALVIVESVSGSVPFAADTTLGTLTARTRRSLIAPASLGPLAPVVERAGALKLDDRYPDASTMRQALADVGDALPPPAPLPLAGMLDRADPHPTRAVPTRPAPLFDQDAIEVVPEPWPALPPDNAGAGRSHAHSERRLVPVVVALAILIAVALGAAGLAHVRSSGSVSVPLFEGLSQSTAARAANQAGLTVSYALSRNAPDPAGQVIAQDPQPGTFTGGHHVTLVLSAGPAKVSVPNVVGQPWTQAKATLDAAGILYDASQHRYDAKVPKGNVVSVTPPAGNGIDPDAQKVVVVRSDGHAPVTVPDVTGLTYAEASTELTHAQFKVKRAPDQFSDTVPSGSVISTNPPPQAKVAYGSQIDITVSKGSEQVTVPDVRGLPLAGAIIELNNVGLAFDAGSKARPTDIVIDESPAPGTSVPKNTTTVTLTLVRAKG
jgi:serine/threonine-protein kinase